MAVYKVPQDVEAEDKLLGPFSFRQFVYLVIVALAIGLAWALSRIFIAFAVIPLPIILFFGALALPLRKDQPMEIYLAALISFYLKPHRRTWDPDGVASLIEITVPKVEEVSLTKNITQTEAQRRLGYLAEIVDSQGWAVRGPGVQAPNSAINSDVYFEAQQTQDVMDESTITAQTFDQKLTQKDNQRHQEMIQLMAQKPTNVAPPTPKPVVSQPKPVATPATTPDVKLQYNPYPTSMNQAVIQPLNEPENNVNTSNKPVSADIIKLANNADLSIETIAREANRIQKKQDMEQEVVISLR